MAPLSSVRWIFAMLLVYTLITDATDRKCPGGCRCYFSKMNWVTDCSWMKTMHFFFYTPFQYIEMDVHTINMAGNMQFIRNNKHPSLTHLKVLNLSYNYMYNFTIEDFAEFRNLEYVDISNNDGQTIDPNAFQDAIGLTTIVSNNNPLYPLNGPILNVSTLLNLYLANSDLKRLTPQTFANVTNLNILDLSTNPLKTIEPGVLDPLKNLRYLYLNNCSLTYIFPKTFNELKFISILGLGNNNFKNQISWTAALNPLGELEFLDVRNSSISILNENVFFNNTLLRRLVLAENKLSNTDIITTLGKNLANLHVLDLSYCKLEGNLLKTALANATELHTLYLTGNNLISEFLDEALLPLDKLVKLSVKDCELTKFPVTDNIHLKELDISINKLNLTYSYPMDSLEHLDMGYNNLENISVASFSNMSKLKSLVLSGNKLKNLEKGLFTNLESLKVLELNKCGLKKLNNTIFYEDVPYPNLEELRLSENPIQTRREGSILPYTMSNLNILDMSKCNLTNLTKDYFITSPNIKKLYLNNNTLFSNHMEYLEHLTNIEYLDVSFNYMTSVTPETFKYNNRLVSMNLVENSWVCDCSTVAVREWALARNIELRGYLFPWKESNWEQFLTCEIELNNTFINATLLEMYSPYLVFYHKGHVNIHWTDFLIIASCPETNKNATSSSKIYTGEVHGTQSTILESDNGAPEHFSLMNIWVIMLIILIIVVFVFTKYKKQVKMLNNYKCENPRNCSLVQRLRTIFL